MPTLRAAELRTLRAIAEALAPGNHRLPAAEREVPVAEPLAAHLATLPPRTLRRLRLALRVVEWLPFPWRFSRADLDGRAAYLRRMETSSRALVRDLLLLFKGLVTIVYAGDPRVAEAVGYEARCALREGEPPPPSEPLGDLTPPPGPEECDVAIVGSGAGGAVAAAVLAEAGLDVIVLEAGPYLRRGDYPTEPLAALRTLNRAGGLTVAEGRPAVPLPVGRVVGGTTLVNSGTCLRPPEQVLEGWREQAGLEWAPELAGELDEIERMLRVTPVDPDRMGRNGQLCMEGAAALGVSGGPIPRNAGHCVQCSSCPFGCRIDAKRGMHVSYLPRAVAAGARLRAGVEVRRVLVERGRAVGVRGRVAQAEGPGREYEVRARAVISAGGALGTPELLLRSGLGGDSGQLGRHLRIHPACWVGAMFDEPVRGWEGVMQSYYVDQWHDRGILLEATFTPLAFGIPWLAGAGREYSDRMLGYDRVASIGVHLSDRSSGRVDLTRDGSLRVGYRLIREDAERIRFGIARAAEIHLAAGAREVYPQVAWAEAIKPGGVAGFESARVSLADLRLEAFHPMGTARIDADPARGVVAPSGEVYGTPGLYVADASLFPGPVGVNPMLTIIALAQRIGRSVSGALG